VVNGLYHRAIVFNAVDVVLGGAGAGGLFQFCPVGVVRPFDPVPVVFSMNFLVLKKTLLT
jgi:hypothetical protein